MNGAMRIIGAVLLALAAFAMIAGDLMARELGGGERAPTSQRFILSFDMFAPADLSCEASGPGVVTYTSRDLAGKPVLRVTGNAAGAEILCSRPDGTVWRAMSNRTAEYTPSSPTKATVTFTRGMPAMTTVLRIDGQRDAYDFKSFVRVD